MDINGYFELHQMRRAHEQLPKPSGYTHYAKDKNTESWDIGHWWNEVASETPPEDRVFSLARGMRVLGGIPSRTDIESWFPSLTTEGIWIPN